MKDNQNTSGPNHCRIFDKTLKTWIDVPDDFFREYDRERTACRKRMQDHGRCNCPRNKWWLCDTFCEECEFRCAGDLLSLDAPEGDGSATILDQKEADGPRLEDLVADQFVHTASDFFIRFDLAQFAKQRISRIPDNSSLVGRLLSTDAAFALFQQVRAE
ncbi:MAG: hypothetical protein II875_03760 [Clostridia bacterium]|nr:hypothetical protein [Clostridia bacterium]MBQ9623229.1 hypothetical protein [Treponema sp.]